MEATALILSDTVVLLHGSVTVSTVACSSCTIMIAILQYCRQQYHRVAPITQEFTVPHDGNHMSEMDDHPVEWNTVIFVTLGQTECSEATK